MSCELIRQSLIDLGWDETTRRQARQILDHLNQCEACQGAVADYDELRRALQAGESDHDVEPAGGWGSFEQRLAEVSLAAPGHQRWRPRLLAVAAILLVGLCGLVAGRLIWGQQGAGSSPALATTTGEPRLAARAFTRGEVVQQVQAFEQVSQVFDRKAGWVVLADGASDMGLADTTVDESNVLLVRLTMTLGKMEVSSADLIIVPGQKAKLTVPLSEGQSVHYRVGTYTDDPTRLSLSAELQTPSGAEPLAALATTLRLQPDQNLTAGRLVTSAGPYELSIAFSRAAVGSTGAVQ